MQISLRYTMFSLYFYEECEQITDANHCITDAYITFKSQNITRPHPSNVWRTALPSKKVNRLPGCDKTEAGHAVTSAHSQGLARHHWNQGRGLQRCPTIVKKETSIKGHFHVDRQVCDKLDSPAGDQARILPAKAHCAPPVYVK